MIDSLIFSLNATIPVFLIMVLGYVLKRRGMFSEGFTNILDKFNFKVTLPILLFADLSASDFYEVWDTRFVLFCFFVTVFSIAAAFCVSMLITKERSLRGEFTQAAFRSSAAILGIAYAQNIFGNAGMVPLMMLGAVPLYNVMSVIILSLTAPGSGGLDRKSMKNALIGIVTNPIIIAIFLGLAFSLIRIPVPGIIKTSLNSMAGMASPLALIGMGAGFEFGKAAAMLKPSAIASFFKLLVWPVLFLPLAVYLGFNSPELVAILIMLGSPTTVSCYIMAKNMGHEGVLTSGAVVITLLMSSVSITFWLFVLRNAGLV